jgi:hypothetical protein
LPGKTEVNSAKSSQLETWLWLALAASVALRLALPVLENPVSHLYSDMLRHWENAVRFFEPDLMSAMDPPVYQLTLKVLRRLLGDSAGLYGLASGLLSASVPLVFLGVGRAWGLAPIPALIAAVLIGWHPSLIAPYNFFMMETLLIPLAGAAAIAAGLYWQRGTTGWFLLAVIGWTLAVLTKPNIAVLGVLLMLPGWWRHSRKGLRAAQAIILSVLLMVPSGLRSWEYFGTIEPAGSPFIARLVFAADAAHIAIEWDGSTYQFLSPANTVAPLRPLSAWQSKPAREKPGVFYRLSAANRGADWQGVLQQTHRSAEVRLRQTAENAIHTLFSDAWPDADSASRVGIAQIHTRWIWAPLIIGCLLASLWLLARRRPVPVFVGASALYALFLILQPVAQIEGRFRKPLEPFLLLAAVQLACLRVSPVAPGPSRARDISSL